MKAEDIFRVGRTLCAVGVLIGAASCGSGGTAPAVHHSSQASRAALKNRQAGAPGQLQLADMVAAVSASKPGPPIELRFFLPVRPEVGQAMDIDVAVIPRAPVPDSVWVSFQVVDGLEIIDGAQLPRVDNLVDGAPVRHVVRVLPKRDGIFAITAVASFVASNQESMRTFSIPVIAGEGMAEQVAKGP